MVGSTVMMTQAVLKEAVVVPENQLRLPQEGKISPLFVLISAKLKEMNIRNVLVRGPVDILKSLIVITVLFQLW